MVYKPIPKSRGERISELEEQITASHHVLRNAVKEKKSGIACLVTGLAIPTVVCGAIRLATGENPYHTGNYFLNTLSVVSTTYGALLTLVSGNMLRRAIPDINSSRKEIQSLTRKLKTYR